MSKAKIEWIKKQIQLVVHPEGDDDDLDQGMVDQVVIRSKIKQLFLLLLSNIRQDLGDISEYSSVLDIFYEYIVTMPNNEKIEFYKMILDVIDKSWGLNLDGRPDFNPLDLCNDDDILMLLKMFYGTFLIDIAAKYCPNNFKKVDIIRNFKLFISWLYDIDNQTPVVDVVESIIRDVLIDVNISLRVKGMVSGLSPQKIAEILVNLLDKNKSYFILRINS